MRRVGAARGLREVCPDNPLSPTPSFTRPWYPHHQGGGISAFVTKGADHRRPAGGDPRTRTFVTGARSGKDPDQQDDRRHGGLTRAAAAPRPHHRLESCRCWPSPTSGEGAAYREASVGATWPPTSSVYPTGVSPPPQGGVKVVVIVKVPPQERKRHRHRGLGRDGGDHLVGAFRDWCTSSTRHSTEGVSGAAAGRRRRGGGMPAPSRRRRRFTCFAPASGLLRGIWRRLWFRTRENDRTAIIRR